MRTGAYGYPMGDAADIAVRTAADHLRNTPSILQVTFVCFGGYAKQAYDDRIARCT